MSGLGVCSTTQEEAQVFHSHSRLYSVQDIT